MNVAPTAIKSESSTTVNWGYFPRFSSLKRDNSNSSFSIDE